MVEIRAVRMRVNQAVVLVPVGVTSGGRQALVWVAVVAVVVPVAVDVSSFQLRF